MQGLAEGAPCLTPGQKARPSILALLALAGCAAPEPESYVPVIHDREAIVQTIPRGGYVELNGG